MCKVLLFVVLVTVSTGSKAEDCAVKCHELEESLISASESYEYAEDEMSEAAAFCKAKEQEGYARSRYYLAKYELDESKFQLDGAEEVYLTCRESCAGK